MDNPNLNHIHYEKAVIKGLRPVYPNAVVETMNDKCSRVRNIKRMN